MSVFTSVSRLELEEFLIQFDVGQIVSFQGIASGIENTNYFVTTEHGEYVLTLFEKLDAVELPFFLNLTAFLAEHGVPCAHPLRTHRGHYLSQLKDKPAALVRKLFGASIERVDTHHCAAVGHALATLHVAGSIFPQTRANDRGPHWWKITAQALFPKLSGEDAVVLKEELRFQSLYRHSDLPRGIIHADLFRDNVLFDGVALSGVIDFYYACTDVLLYDVAVTLNDWCSGADGKLQVASAQALLTAYQAVRPMNAIERGTWPTLLRAAALRFWLSRLYDLHFPRAGEITHTKDPEVFKRILLARIADEYQLRGLWPVTRGGGLGQKATT